MINIRRLLKSFTYAASGIDHALNNDQNLIVHFIGACVVIILGIILKVNTYEMGLLGLTIVMVIATEMINTAIEKMVDLITKEHRMEAKIAKDVSSGMVLVTAIGAVVIGLIVFVPHILDLLK